MSRNAFSSRGALLFSSAPLQCQRRWVTRLYTSYYTGVLYPNQLVQPKQRLPADVSVSAILQKRSELEAAAKRGSNKGNKVDVSKGEKTPGVSWDDADSTDVMRVDNTQQLKEAPQVERPYVPLGEVAKLELQGDYYMEGGMFQEALEHYGVVAKAYNYAYPENHAQRIGIRIKLSAAFRQTGRLESSLANIEEVLRMLDASTRPSLELICEALLELGITREALGMKREATEAYEEALEVVNSFHNWGESHRMLRLLPRLGRRFNYNFEEKFVYFSPFDYDRTFALVDQCLERAETTFNEIGDVEGAIRVLQQRKEMIDKKFFNMRDFAGRIHTMRGHWKRRAQHLTNAPTPDELLRYSPTIHQVHRDFKFELTAPIGREKEVMPGVNRLVLDMGNPYRRRGRLSNKMLKDADHKFANYVRQKEYNE
ncbi:Tetratricopeptide repeat, putative [Trypanosoma equiperdum]|uniref:Tetratricopeptide repeat n=2 Tax=Trypanozoon TaxID=39700 RepID=Q585Z1_TRYB2|nr:hypothetical protein, conserved [Trypanosoma brucei brucei TREU927]AAX80768.1 hypothetical protein, conserved [Trypanosoma brucei]AAZ11952.1 hypothetical protein, conserved [Trypanosoma brucei brucei TREU927]SCU68126.1 Tetratricopeptide repeat, putative [Trypanosoma equiperdum]